MTHLFVVAGTSTCKSGKPRSLLGFYPWQTRLKVIPPQQCNPIAWLGDDDRGRGSLLTCGDVHPNPGMEPASVPRRWEPSSTCAARTHAALPLASVRARSPRPRFGRFPVTGGRDCKVERWATPPRGRPDATALLDSPPPKPPKTHVNASPPQSTLDTSSRCAWHLRPYDTTVSSYPDTRPASRAPLAEVEPVRFSTPREGTVPHRCDLDPPTDTNHRWKEDMQTLRVASPFKTPAPVPRWNAPELARFLLQLARLSAFVIPALGRLFLRLSASVTPALGRLLRKLLTVDHAKTLVKLIVIACTSYGALCALYWSISAIVSACSYSWDLTSALLLELPPTAHRGATTLAAWINRTVTLITWVTWTTLSVAISLLIAALVVVNFYEPAFWALKLLFFATLDMGRLAARVGMALGNPENARVIIHALSLFCASSMNTLQLSCLATLAGYRLIVQHVPRFDAALALTWQVHQAPVQSETDSAPATPAPPVIRPPVSTCIITPSAPSNWEGPFPVRRKAPTAPAAATPRRPFGEVQQPAKPLLPPDAPCDSREEQHPAELPLPLLATSGGERKQATATASPPDSEPPAPPEPGHPEDDEKRPEAPRRQTRPNKLPHKKPPVRTTPTEDAGPQVHTKIGTLNVRGKSSLEEIANAAYQHHLDIMVATEVGCSRTVDTELGTWYSRRILWMQSDLTAHHYGVGFVVRTGDGAPTVIGTKWLSPRVGILKTRWKGRNLTIIGVYGPIENADQAEKREFWSHLAEAVDSAKRTTVIILGDFNAHIPGPASSAPPNANGMELLEFMSTFDYELTNSLLFAPGHSTVRRCDPLRRNEVHVQ